MSHPGADDGVERAAGINQMADGLTRLYDARFESVTPDRVTMTLPVTQVLLQPFGIVHGGVYCFMVETMGSVGGSVWLQESRPGATVVGSANNTNFLRATRTGSLHGEATPIHRGRSQQLWLVVISDDAGRVLARGELRLANIESTDQLAKA